MNNIVSYLQSNTEPVFIIMLSVLLGIEVISHVPSVLHTPLMSGSNAISGIIIIGSIILVGHADTSCINAELVIGLAALFAATLNVAGGYVVTDRMLDMFKNKKNVKK